jgi:hypothetical protein
MWPRLLFELLPHFARLLPAADKYLASRGPNDKAHEAALAALGEDVRGQVGPLVEAQRSISRQLGEQGTQLAEMSVEVTRARMGVESVEERVARLEGKADAAMKLLGATLTLLLGAVGLLAAVLVKLHRG